MKQVVHNLPTDIVSVAHARHELYYGMQQTDGIKSFVTKTEYFYGHYRESFLEDLTEGNSTMMDLDSKIKDLPAFLKHKMDKDRKVFQFETGKELFNWLTD